MSTYFSPNPLPADIDWERVERTLGLTIKQSGPGGDQVYGDLTASLFRDLGLPRQADVSRPPVSDPCDRDAGSNDDRQEPVVGLDLDDAPRATRSHVPSEFAGPFPAVAQPVGPPVVVQIHFHGTSNSSVSRDPEGTTAAGSPSGDSAAGCGECHP